MHSAGQLIECTIFDAELQYNEHPTNAHSRDNFLIFRKEQDTGKRVMHQVENRTLAGIRPLAFTLIVSNILKI